MAKGDQFGVPQTALQSIQSVMLEFNDAFDYLPAKDAMSYLADDSNLEDKGLFILPAKGLKLDVDKEKAVANGIVDEKDADRMVDVMRWKIGKQTIFKADLMILDMVAHFDWNRSIYFASSASPSTYLGLTKYFFAEGLVYKMVPIEVKANRNPNSLGEVNKPKMYANLMNIFHWGNMQEKGVLIDYYTRRLTNNYRVQFAVLADAYVEQIDQEKQKLEMLKQIQAQEGPEDQVVKTPLGNFVRAEVNEEIAKSKAVIDSNKVFVTQVLDKSNEVMPEFNVPYGRVIPSYISSYYAVGDEEKARMYTDRMLELFQEDINYYLDIDPEFSSQMVQDIFDSYRGVFSLYQATQIYDTDPAYKDKVSNVFFDVSTKIQSGLNPIRKISPSARNMIQNTFDKFFSQING